MKRGRLWQVYRRWLPRALVLTAAANLVISLWVPVPAQPIRPHSDGSLTHLVHTEQPTVDRRYGLYLELGDSASGGVLVIPRGSFIEVAWAQTLSTVDVIEMDYDPDLVSVGTSLGRPTGVVTTADGDSPFWIVPGEGANRWWLARNDIGIVIAQESELLEVPP